MADVVALPRTSLEMDWHDSFFLLATDPAVQGLEGIFAAIAATRIPVLIVGEEGTGRTSAARAIHRMEFGSDEGLLIAPAQSLTEPWFTSANGNGFSAAHDNGFSAAGNAAPSTLLLEEISELDSACQWRLAQFLQAEHEGARVIASTRKNLEFEVHSGRFREDLLYCLNRVCVCLPPLRQRKKDIAGFVEFFLTKYAIMFHRSKPEFSEPARANLREYAWPGNLAELEHTIRTFVATDDEQLALAALRRPAARRARNGGTEVVSLKQVARAAVRQAERELIAKALTRTQGNRKRAAAELQISYKALLYKLKQNGLESSARA